MAIDFSGKWVSIFSELGNDKLLYAMSQNGQHAPCPFEGHSNSRDGFRFFKDWTIQGGGCCNSCGHAPNGIKVLARTLGISEQEAFKRAALFVEKSSGSHKPRAYEKPEIFIKPNEVSAEDKVKREGIHESMLKQAKSFEESLAQKYLASRGLSAMPAQDVLFTPSMFYRDKGDDASSKHPAMLAKFRNKEGEVVSLHRTYLNETGTGKANVAKPKKVTAPTGVMTGGAIQLFPIEKSTRLAITEGIETALAVREICGMPVWACYSASLLQGFEPPAQITEVHVFADFDINEAGKNASETLIEKLSTTRPEITVFVHMPPNDGKTSTDWLDWLVLEKSR